MANPKHRSVSLDIVRSVAILAVIGVHSFQHSVALVPDVVADSDRSFVAFSYLRFGVELFFVLSGWLIFAIYWEGRRGLIGYWPKRIARIWPLWMVFTLLSILAAVIPNTLFVETAAPQSANLTGYLLTVAVIALFLGWTGASLWNVPDGGWSIQAEMGHYALFALLFRRKAMTMLMSVLVGYASYFIARQLAQMSQPESALKWFCDAWIRLGLYGTWPFFLAGGFALICWRRSHSDVRGLGRVLLSRPDLLAVSIVIAVIARWIPVPFGTSYEAGAVVLLLLMGTWLVAKIVALQRSLASIGQYSYFMYFAHFWILEIVLAVLLSRAEQFQTLGFLGLACGFLIFFSVSVSISWLFALASWRWFESIWLRIAARSHL